MRRVLCFDFGATSGRAIICSFSGEKIELEELHRFDNSPVEINGVLQWDILRLFHELKTGMLKAKAKGFDSIGIDTWGVDFGLIDKRGNLMANPVHYRDSRTDSIMQEAFEIIPKEEIYAKTGIQFMKFNTIFQLLYLKKYQPEVLEEADKMLFIPDLLGYFLTGKMTAERSVTSTSQLYDPVKHDWAYDIINTLGFKRSLFPKIVDSGTLLGTLSNSICNELGVSAVPVYSVCGHDTSSAIAAIPSLGNAAFISCGTWSLLGTELNKPNLSQASFNSNFTNEIGYEKTAHHLKNIMGLWIINECKRDWEKEGNNLSYSEIASLATKSNCASIIDVDDDSFSAPYKMVERIKDYCVKHGQPAPQTIGDIARCVYQSLAQQYAKMLNNLELLVGQKFECLHIIGGGCNASFLMQLTANAINKPVLCEPSEATVFGNAIVQLLAQAQIETLPQARTIIKNSIQLKEYLPQQ